jgi:hypothetical protein
MLKKYIDNQYFMAIFRSRGDAALAEVARTGALIPNQLISEALDDAIIGLIRFHRLMSGFLGSGRIAVGRSWPRRI